MWDRLLFEHLYSPRMVAEIKEGKNRNSKRTNSDVTLTKVCNSITMTTKEKRLANTDIEISQLSSLNFLHNLLLFISSISVSMAKLQKERQSSMMSLFAVLYNFIKNLMTTKSSECRSALNRE